MYGSCSSLSGGFSLPDGSCSPLDGGCSTLDVADSSTGRYLKGSSSMAEGVTIKIHLFNI